MESVVVKEEGGSPGSSGARIFSLRIVQLDYYMTAPLPGMDTCYSHFQGRDVREVPVVRIFGSTTAEQKTCLHLHKAFPYFYVAYDDDLPQEVNEALAYVRRLASAVEKALKMASSAGAKRQHVHSCSLVRGRKYYGYYPNEQLFVKIVLYYPQEVSRVSTLLLSGGIMNHKFQPYEAHIPYLLQILIDYNLAGMGHLHLSSLKFRGPLPGVRFSIKRSLQQVKSEFLFERSGSTEETRDSDSTPMDMACTNEIKSQNKKLNPMLHLSPLVRDEPPSINPVCKSMTPDSNQSTPVAGSQAEIWLHGSVPGEWIWPIVASSQGQGAYSRQSTCELEADTSVEDILNRGELLFKPLQEAGPEVKMVQSLTPIWEEELLRSGEGGPAGQVDSHYQPTARTVQLPCPLEEAMRDALVQIAESDLHRVGGTQGLQVSSPGVCSAPECSRTTAETCFMQTSEKGAMVISAGNQNLVSLAENREVRPKTPGAPLESTGERAPAKESLFECTQVANGEPSFVSPVLQSEAGVASKFQMVSGGTGRVPGLQGTYDEEFADLEEDDDKSIVNVEAIKSHLSQRVQSQELDKEVAEFLRWMGATQEPEQVTNEVKESDIAFSQIFSSPGMDSALLKALAEYESTTQRECDAILECADEEEEQLGAPPNMDVASWRQGLLKEDGFETGLRASTSSSSMTDTYKNKIRQEEISAIPQIDGACDEENLDGVVDPDGSLFASMRSNVVSELDTWLDVKLRGNLDRSSGGVEAGYRASRMSSMDNTHGRYVLGWTNDQKGTVAYIPQIDGACDEEKAEDVLDNNGSRLPSKKQKIDVDFVTEMNTFLDEKSRGNLQRSSGEGSKEVSVRDLMRRQRERRPSHHKERSFPPSVLPENAIDVIEPGVERSAQSTSGSEGGRMRGPRDGQMMKVPLMVESRRTSENSATTTGRSAEKDLALGKKGKKSLTAHERGRFKSSKYGALPIVKVKSESAKEDLQVQNLDKPEREKSSNQVLSGTDEANGKEPQVFKETVVAQPVMQTLMPNEKYTRKEDCVISVSRGDDRDCGGGWRPCTYSSESGSLWDPDGLSKRQPASSSIVRPDVNEWKLGRDGYSGVDIENIGDSTKHDHFNTSENLVQSNRKGREIIEPSSAFPDKFTDTQPPPPSERSMMEPLSKVLLEDSGNASERDLEHSFIQEKREEQVEGAAGELVGLDHAGDCSTQYHFTDMSDDSQNSFDSGTGPWVKEGKWDAAKGFYDDEEHKEYQSLFTQEQKQESESRRGNSALLPTEATKDGKSPTPLRLSEQDPLCSPSPTSDTRGLSIGMGLFSGPMSSFPSTVGHSTLHGSSAVSITPSSTSSPDALKQPLPIPLPESSKLLGPVSQSTSACEKSEVHDREITQGVITYASPWPAREEDSETGAPELASYGGVSGSASATQSLLKKEATGHKEWVHQQTDCENMLLEAEDEQLETQAPVSYRKEDKTQGLFPLIFHQRPPDREQVMASFRELAPSFRDEGAVYYGNVKDVSDRPTVMAGLIFDVKSRKAVHLSPFTFGGSGKRSNFEQGSRCRAYIERGNWGAEHEMDAVIGVPSHFKNDGTVLYPITPVRPPPSPIAVKQWVSSIRKGECTGNAKDSNAGRERMFTMDANTGKLVPLVDIGRPESSQDGLTQAGASQEDVNYERPASPKYAEKHVLHPTDSFAVPLSGSTQRRPDLSYQIDHGAIGPSLDSAPEKLPPGHSKSPSVSLEKDTLGSGGTGNGFNKRVNGVMPGGMSTQDQESKWPSKKLMLRSPGQWRDVSQMTAMFPAGHSTPLSQAGFRDPASTGGGQQITLMSIEVFAETRGDLLPDPRYDAIGCIVLVIYDDGARADTTTLVLIRDKEAHTNGRYLDAITGCEIIYLPDEAGLFKCFARLVHLCDPDMLLGWEIQGYSLGLLAERAATLGISLLKQLSRIPPVNGTGAEISEKDTGLEELAGLFDNLPQETKVGNEPIIEDEWGRTHGSGLSVGGRIVLNIWRIMRGEVKLAIYSLEAVAEAVLKRRVPRVPWRTLARWFSLGPARGRFRCLEYFINRARLNLEIMDQLDLVNRTAELARVFGIDFYSVFSRGSQFRVESMMARLAHTQNYILVSPTRQQVADQPAMECIPLVMEPESRFYTSPVIVLDFQSLYPSMIIAYNLCFSTCLGKLVPDNPKVFGVTKLLVQPGVLESLKECMTMTPNGVMFVPPKVRPGVLPRLLQEILSTRIMVKKAMKKLPPDQRVLQRVLNARQFALKLIANVTYGYTAAGFSGRMPCAEIADSIVQCGRLTLERAIHLVNSHPRWGARVVYGDTDSMFVLLEGRTREEAHGIGQEIAAAVTETNPPPVALKMEKVYHPCVLLTKKRYVGYSYESASQVKPTFDAKGIETIRRDSCPAVAKTLEHSLRLLFETQDLSQVKEYLQRQWGKIMSGRISLKDFIFAKEVRLGTYSSRSPVLPPAAIVASKAMAVDPRAEPRYAERIPYVVVHGEPGARLVDMVVDPLTVLDDPSLRLHDTYYITKQIIPACQRVFMLVGVDLRTWFSEMPRVYRPPVSKRVSNLAAAGARSTKWDPDGRKKQQRVGTIDQYYLSKHCTICGAFTRASQLLCSKCILDPRAAAILLPGRTSRLERELKHLQAICRHCGGEEGSPEGSIACISLDCPVLFERRKVHRELQAAGAVASDLGYYPPCLPELF